MKSKFLFFLSLLIAGFAQAAPQEVGKTTSPNQLFSVHNFEAFACYLLVGVLLIGTLVFAAKVKAYERQVNNEKLKTAGSNQH